MMVHNSGQSHPKRKDTCLHHEREDLALALKTPTEIKFHLRPLFTGVGVKAFTELVPSPITEKAP